MLLGWYLLQTELLCCGSSGSACSGLKRTIPISQHSHSACVGSSLPFVHALLGLLCKGLLSGWQWKMWQPCQPLCCVPAGRRRTPREGWFLQLAKCRAAASGSRGKVPHAAIWHSDCGGTEHIVVLDLGRRSWQCACWDAAFGKRWEREGCGGERANVAVPCVPPWSKCWGRGTGCQGTMCFSFCHERTSCSSEWGQHRPPKPWWDSVSVTLTAFRLLFLDWQ